MTEREQRGQLILLLLLVVVASDRSYHDDNLSRMLYAIILLVELCEIGKSETACTGYSAPTTTPSLLVVGLQILQPKWSFS